MSDYNSIILVPNVIHREICKKGVHINVQVRGLPDEAEIIKFSKKWRNSVVITNVFSGILS